MNKSIVIAYEDEYFTKLHALVKRLRNERGHVGHIIEPRSMEGTGNFIREVPSLMRMPLKQTKRPPDLVVCLADADKPGNLVPGTAPAPMSKDPAVLSSWVQQFERTWRDHLIGKGSLDEDAARRLSTVCLRWNKESILLASPEALCDYARKYEREAETRAILERCKPSPLGLASEAFLVEYRTQERCLDQVCQAIHARDYKKGLHDEDILNDYLLAAGAEAEARRVQVWQRCPDLARLLDVLS